MPREDPLTQPTIAVVAAVIAREGRFLLTQRGPEGRLAGYWEFPGGKIEPGESPAAALRRELREELGVTIEVGERVGQLVHDYPARRVELEFLAAELVDGEPRPLEVADLGWFRPEEMADLPLLPADLPLVPRLAARVGAPDGRDR
jgi:8-oxo-dGTP diphosphatase